MQKIIIKDFGPIPYCELKIDDFMLFIGEQSTGKSTICKCIYFFKSVRDEIKSYLHGVLENGIVPDKRFPWAINSSLKYKFVSLFGMSTFKGNFLLKYDYNEDLSLEITVTKDEKRYLDFKFNSNMVRQVRILEEQVDNKRQSHKSIEGISDLYQDLEKSKYLLVMDGQVNKLFCDNRENFYIPAGRGLLSLLTNQLLNIELMNMDYITSDFMKLIQRERVNFDVPLTTLANNIEAVNNSASVHTKNDLAGRIKAILKGEYCYRNGKEYIGLKDRSSLPINFASSGQQEILWILNLLFLWMLKGKKIFVVIEEPEAHLFPSAQKEIVEYILLFANSNDNQVMITTHSPYILTSSNNLLYAGKIGMQKNNDVDRIISKDKWINPAKFGAYLVGSNKEAYIRSIIDEELQEIASEEIDGISKTIRNDYAEIFNVEANDEHSEQARFPVDTTQ